MKQRPIIVDMFCGAGGESQGIHWSLEKAELKAEVYAINHWERAIETHAANFPSDNHVCRNVQDIDPGKLIRRKRVSLLWASPACTHYSVARGGKPMDDQMRITPFTICDWLDKLTVDRVIIENVPEFTSWGPLDISGKPIKASKGDTFKAFIVMIMALGYIVDWRVSNAADYGVPTTRRRLFIQAIRKGSGKRILWPEQTHISTDQENLFSADLQKWIPTRDIIDWSLPTQIIDERKRPLAENTMKRIRQGIQKFWPEHIARPFLVRYNGGDNRVHSIDDPIPVLDTSNRYGLVEPFITSVRHGKSYNRGKSLDEPLPSLTTKGEHCLIEPIVIASGHTSSRNRAKTVREPLSTIVTKSEHYLVEPLVVKFSGKNNCESIDRPLTSVRTSGTHHGIIEPLVVNFTNNQGASKIDEPLKTIRTKDHHGIVEPLVMEYYGNGQCKPVSEPLGVVTTKERFALVTPENVRLGFRMLKPHELSAAQSFPKDYVFTGTRTEIVKQIGNAVCPKHAHALTAEYCRELVS